MCIRDRRESHTHVQRQNENPQSCNCNTCNSLSHNSPHRFSEGKDDLSSEDVEHVGWGCRVGHYPIALHQLVEGEVISGDITRGICIITTGLQEPLRPDHKYVSVCVQCIRPGKLNSQFIITAHMEFWTFPNFFRFHSTLWETACLLWHSSVVFPFT